MTLEPPGAWTRAGRCTRSTNCVEVAVAADDPGPCPAAAAPMSREVRRATAVQLYRKPGASVQSVSDEMGVAFGTTYRDLRSAGIELRHRGGGAVGRTFNRPTVWKLTRQQCLDIREAYAADETLKMGVLADRYGVSPTLICHVCKGIYPAAPGLPNISRRGGRHKASSTAAAGQ